MLNKIKKILKATKNKAVLICDSKNISYITGAGFEGFWIIIYKNKIYAVTSEMIKGQLMQFFGKSINITAGKNFGSAVIDICKKLNIKELYINTENLSYDLFNALSEKLKKEKIKTSAGGNIISNLRAIKNKDEIKNIKKACEIVSEVFESVRKKIVPGMKEIDLHFKIVEEFARYHTIESFQTIVAIGPNAANPHHVSGNRKIQKNDVVLIDMGCKYNGYCSDLTRTIIIGNKIKYEKVWNIVKTAHDMAQNAVKPKITCDEIDLKARDIIKKAGYGDKFIHTTGHGVGLDIHESPSVSEKSKTILEEGMVITIEPGIYLENKFGVRIEDTVLVTKNGFKKLTTASY